MRTLQVSISDIEYLKFGIKKNKITFTELVDLVTKESMRQDMLACLQLAEENGLSSMTMEEITQEVKAVRKNAKSNT